MEALWLRARQVHLDEPCARVFRPVAPADMFEMLGIRHPVIADITEPLRYEDKMSTLTVTSRHFKLPAVGDEEERSGRPPEPRPQSGASDLG